MKNVSTLPATLEKALDNLQTSHDHIKSNVEETYHVIIKINNSILNILF